MYEIMVTGHFDAAHFLSGYCGKCRNIHGHRWKVEVYAESKTLSAEEQTRDMVLDFSDLKKVLRRICEELDHTLIYEERTLKDVTVHALREEGFSLTAVPFRPTAERFAHYFYERLTEICPQVVRTIVYETPDNAAVYEERS